MNSAILVSSGLLTAGLLLGQITAADPGAVAEGLRLYTSNCASCHGVEGDSVQGVNLRGGQFRRVAGESDLAKLITSGIPGTAMPPTSFTAAQVVSVIAYLSSLRAAPVQSSTAGDSKRGQAILEGKGGCLKCHQVGGRGSRLGPDLSEIGKIRSSANLESSILEPDMEVLPLYRFVRAVTTQGLAIYGRRLNEDTLTVQLIDSNEQLLSLPRTRLREYVVLKTSAMPAYKGKLTTQDLADLVTYLSSLK